MNGGNVVRVMASKTECWCGRPDLPSLLNTSHRTCPLDLAATGEVRPCVPRCASPSFPPPISSCPSSCTMRVTKTSPSPPCPATSAWPTARASLTLWRSHAPMASTKWSSSPRLACLQAALMVLAKISKHQKSKQVPAQLIHICAPGTGLLQ